MNDTSSLWRNEFVQHTFTFEGRRAIVVCPAKENQTDRWLLKTEYFDAFQDLEYAMVKQGFHLAFLENHSRWVAPGDLEAKFRFRCFLMQEYGLRERCIPVGMSCGGLHAIKQAAYYPEMVSALCLDAPVVNLLSCPLGLGVGTSVHESAQAELLAALGLTHSDMLSYRDHPLDLIPHLIRNRIPMLLICGDADTSVPFDENGRHIKALYEQTDIPFCFLSKPGCGHHPHGPLPAQMAQAVAFLTRAG